MLLDYTDITVYVVNKDVKPVIPTSPQSAHQQPHLSPTATLSSSFIARNIAWARSCGLSVATARLIAVHEAIIASSLRARNRRRLERTPLPTPETCFISRTTYKEATTLERVFVSSTWSQDGTSLSRRLSIKTTVSETPTRRLGSPITLSGRQCQVNRPEVKRSRHSRLTLGTDKSASFIF